MDSAGDPVAGVFVRPNGHAFGALTDSLGRFSDSGRLVPIKWVDVLCSDRMRGQSIRLPAPFGETGNPADTVQDLGIVVFATDRCEGPRRPTSGEFRGLFSGGFEESSFRPCGLYSGVPAEVNGDIWVSFPRDLATTDRMWERFPKGYYKPAESLYIHVVGQLHGPGIFGHMGGASYELTIDSLVEARRMEWKECRSLPPMGRR